MRLIPALAVGLVALGVVTTTSAQTSTKPTVVADNLDNPRGLIAARDGSIYFAQAGAAGKTCIRDGCAGFSGSISRIAPDGKVGTVGAGFLSLGGDDGTFATGVDDVAVADDGGVYTVVTSIGPRIPSGLPKSVTAKIKFQSGRVMRIDAGGKLVQRAKVDKLEYKRDADKAGEESNPYGITAASNGKLYVVDAAANTLVEVTGTTARVIAVFPPATKRPAAQAVPTVVREGPDSALYVGELSGDAAPNKKARVWRVVPGSKPVVFARGFSRITGLAFGPDRSMYVSQLSLNFAKQSPKGSIVRVKPDKSRSTIGAGKLSFPAGVAVAPDGSIYVANWSVLPRRTSSRGPFEGAHGQILRFAP